MRLLALSSLVVLLSGSVYADPGGLYPPGLLPLINRANAMLSTGQFHEAAKIYSEAIDQSPADYLLYYKRATAYFSLNRHTSALDDFERVLNLTSNTFDNAHLMKARIHAKDGEFGLARQALRMYTKARGADTAGKELAADIDEGHSLADKAEKEHRAQLWNACVESSSSALRVASHSIEIRQMRVECALAAGDVESAVGDLTRLTHLLPPSTSLHTRIFRLSYFLLAPSPAPLNTLKQCLHYDPDSKPCLTMHRLLKSFDRAFTSLDELLEKEDWRGALTLLLKGGRKGELMRRFDQALEEHTDQDMLLGVTPTTSATTGKKATSSPPIPLPTASMFSPRRQTLIRALCRAYTALDQPLQGPSGKKAPGSTEDTWCELLLRMDGCAEDVDGLVGLGEVLLGQEEWEEGVRVLDKAFEASGRSRRDIHQRLQRAQRLLKQSKQKDYYKVLGVSRDADARTIKKAFRTAAKTAHPDKGGTEAKMAQVNEAYEVLSKPELRERFDNGDDPNDPMAGQGGGYPGGHPFFAQGGGHPFAQFFQQGGNGGGHGGGGFNFHFSGR